MAFEQKMMEYAGIKAAMCSRNDAVPDDLLDELGVYRGLRDQNGKGVLTGLTNISTILSFRNVNGERVPIDGELYYRGYPVQELVSEFAPGGFGFEKTAYLLLFGEKPSDADIKEFKKILAKSRTLPTNFTRDVIMKAPGKDVMNSMTRSILSLAPYDNAALAQDLPDNIRQCLMLIATFPMLAVYGYHAYNHYENFASMYIHRPDPKRSTAENLLMMLRPDEQYTETEARVLDVALMLHAEHGGGNNSTFTTRVVTSSGSDTYSAMAAAMSSLKGPRHGGANIKVMEMMEDIRTNVKDWTDLDEVKNYLGLILDKKAFDHKGLIYGMGHAVYSISDPRELVFKDYVLKLVAEKHRYKDLVLYENIEKVAPEVIAEKRHIFKGVSPNVDFYSGFVYNMLGIPTELFTPLFAVARIAGWSAHRLEELIGTNKIMRPAYLSVSEASEIVQEHRKY
ncbi:MAG: citrate synthase [Lachnospiraceae bacterium]|nr:citrate synthase [Lachnospiraceae bacterium]